MSRGTRNCAFGFSPWKGRRFDRRKYLTLRSCVALEWSAKCVQRTDLFHFCKKSIRFGAFLELCLFEFLHGIEVADELGRHSATVGSYVYDDEFAEDVAGFLVASLEGDGHGDLASH